MTEKWNKSEKFAKQNMGDLNDDLLNYEADLLEDDILDDNEDELLLSDDNADADVLLSDTEDWVTDELRTKPKPDEGDSSNAVSGSNDVSGVVRQDSPEESQPEPRRESTPPRQISPRHEEPSGSNEKTSGHSTVSSTPDKCVEPDELFRSQESGISNTVDSTWVNTPETCVSNNLEEVDGHSLNSKNNNEVSSTNEEDRAAQQQEESKCVSSSIDSTPARSQLADSLEDTPAKSVSSEIVSSNETPLTTSSGTVEREAETTETEEDEREERVNPKLSVEKQPIPDEMFNTDRKGHKFHPGPNNFGDITPLYPSRSDFPYGPGQNRAPFPLQRPGFGPIRGPYFMPRPGFGPMPPGMRPGMLRPDMRPPFVGDQLRPRQQMPMYRGPMGPFPPNVLPPSQMYPMQPPVPVIPKKVLINPNFKGGGLEAAKSQLLKDAQSFGTRPLTDEELLRQQEEFITKNLMHVEKRRHESPPLRTRSRSRSPRSRSRSYSPPRKRRSREKDWRPYNNKRNWRRNNDDWNKRRRFGDKEEENPDDDEETREYRRKVAEQKALREKMLRDKERRRRELAEEKKRLLQEEEEKRKKDESALKCKPVVVTKKIISLKSIKSGSDNEDLIKKSSQDSGLSSGDGKKLSLKKSEDDTKTTAVVKPLPKLISKPIIDDIDEKLEAELLEESRTPSPPPPINANRRVIIKSNNAKVEESTEDSKKRIFDRLDRKSAAIGLDSNAKRKIQRLVSDKTK